MKTMLNEGKFYDFNIPGERQLSGKEAVLYFTKSSKGFPTITQELSDGKPNRRKYLHTGYHAAKRSRKSASDIPVIPAQAYGATGSEA